MSKIIKFFFNKKITDATCGFRGFKTKIFNKGKIKFFCKRNYIPMVLSIIFMGKF